MTTIRKIMTSGAILAAALLTAACASADTASAESPADPSRVTVQHGNGYSSELQVVTIRVGAVDVPCVVMVGYREGGVSCDFDRHTAR